MEKLRCCFFTLVKYTAVFLHLFAIFVYGASCKGQTSAKQYLVNAGKNKPEIIRGNKKGIRTIHVFVALCDNKYQGIVPVGKAIGNGQDADNNLYWGCGNGIRTYFKKKSSDWILLQNRKNVSDTILESVLFKHKTEPVYLLADAYDGQHIKQTTIDFLNAAGTHGTRHLTDKDDTIYFGGAANLTAYIGHDGLMDFDLPLPAASADSIKRESIILACYSKAYFSPHLKPTGATPLLWTTGLMAPEAYTLHDALRQWVKKSSPEKIRESAAAAYARYQKCSVKAARNLLVTGW